MRWVAAMNPMEHLMSCEWVCVFICECVWQRKREREREREWESEMKGWESVCVCVSSSAHTPTVTPNRYHAILRWNEIDGVKKRRAHSHLLSASRLEHRLALKGVVLFHATEWEELEQCRADLSSSFRASTRSFSPSVYLSFSISLSLLSLDLHAPHP
jgi:hypothetical protein